jgi:hypothetical protein
MLNPSHKYIAQNKTKEIPRILNIEIRGRGIRSIEIEQ